MASTISLEPVQLPQCERCGTYLLDEGECPSCAYLRTVPHPHRISRDSDTCSLCDVGWSALTERDREMLNEKGICYGPDKEAWRSCRRHRGQLCLGRAHEECREL